MRTIANIIWHIPFLGFLNAAISFVIGTVLVLTVVAAPIGLGLIQYARFLMGPFTNRMVDRSLRPDDDPNLLWKTYGFLIKIIYVPFIGLPLTIVTLVQIIGLICSVVGIPMAIILFKSLGTYLQPVDKVCMSVRSRTSVASLSLTQTRKCPSLARVVGLIFALENRFCGFW